MTEINVPLAPRTYEVREFLAIFATDFGFNWENGGFWI